MPQVRIQYRNYPEGGHLGIEKLHKVEETVKLAGPNLFSVKRFLFRKPLQLKPEDFTVLFEAESMGSLSHDIIVRVELHRFRVRRKYNDLNALVLADAISRALNTGQKVPYTVGVSLLLAEIGWATAPADSKGKRTLDRILYESSIAG